MAAEPLNPAESAFQLETEALARSNEDRLRAIERVTLYAQSQPILRKNQKSDRNIQSSRDIKARVVEPISSYPGSVLKTLTRLLALVLVALAGAAMYAQQVEVTITVGPFLPICWTGFGVVLSMFAVYFQNFPAEPHSSSGTDECDGEEGDGDGDITEEEEEEEEEEFPSQASAEAAFVQEWSRLQQQLLYSSPQPLLPMGYGTGAYQMPSQQPQPQQPAFALASPQLQHPQPPSPLRLPQVQPQEASLASSDAAAPGSVGAEEEGEGGERKQPDMEDETAAADAAADAEATAPVDAITAEANALHASKEHGQLIALLEQHVDSRPDLLWRLSRAHNCLFDNRSLPEEQRRAAALSALRVGKRAAKEDPDTFESHKWLALGISSAGDFQSIKERIGNAHLFRDSTLRALQLKKGDPTCHHMLGRWCYEVSSISWAQRRIASAIFGAPPTSSYKEALKHLMIVEGIAPKQSSTNVFWVAKCHIKLNSPKEARRWLREVVKLPVTCGEDAKAVAAAKKLLA